MNERLQKVLARAGIASRRAAEALIVEGRVTVNGRVADRLGTKVDPEQDSIRVDGSRIRGSPGPIYLALNKPRGYVTTLSDPEGRLMIRDLLRDVPQRVFPVGRLDFHSEGLLLLTNDGPLAHALMHPSHGVSKTYLVKVRGEPTEEVLREIARGISLDGRRTLPARIERKRVSSAHWLQITIREGRKHQVRRMFEAMGHPVLKLRRIRYGGVDLGRLAPGRYRRLTQAEVERLVRMARKEARADRP